LRGKSVYPRDERLRVDCDNEAIVSARGTPELTTPHDDPALGRFLLLDQSTQIMKERRYRPAPPRKVSP
jgi:hypothetical protein